MIDLGKYRRYYRTKKSIQKLIKRGACPICELLLTSRFHTDCPYIQELFEEKRAQALKRAGKRLEEIRKNHSPL